jgi:CubicO group peptidase (beta-lactamase class C family)
MGLAVEKRGDDYRTFPQRVLFDKLCIRDAVLMTDPYGNNLTQGAEYLPAHDWARVANLSVQDGMWNGERLLPEGYVDYVKTLATAWVADGRLVYGGGFMWVNGDGADPIPKDAFSFRGAGGQSTIIISDRDLVVVRIGKYAGAGPGERALNAALSLLMEAVPVEGAAGT